MKALAGKKICIIVENLPVPFDRRVWQESITLRDAGAEVTVICPRTKTFPQQTEVLEGIRIYRHDLIEANGILGYFAEYTSAIVHELLLLAKVFIKHGRQDAIHACNPPDLLFIPSLPFKLIFGTKFLFDHHDINPELWIAKFGQKGIGYYGMRLLERVTFALADHSIATNESYKDIAITRGRMRPEKVTVVRSGPDLRRLQITPPNPDRKKGRGYLVSYVGVMGKQEGIDLLLQSIYYIVRNLGRKDIQFCLMGSGPEFTSIVEQCRNLGLQDFVDLPGRVSDFDLIETLNTSDVCVNPDTPSEMNDKSTMNKIMEYMAIGKPIVQYDLREGRFSAQAASLYATNTSTQSFAERIIELIDDEPKRRSMGAFGRVRVENELSWEHEIPKLISGYTKMFGLHEASNV